MNMLGLNNRTHFRSRPGQCMQCYQMELRWQLVIRIKNFNTDKKWVQLAAFSSIECISSNNDRFVIEKFPNWYQIQDYLFFIFAIYAILLNSERSRVSPLFLLRGSFSPSATDSESINPISVIHSGLKVSGSLFKIIIIF